MRTKVIIGLLFLGYNLNISGQEFKSIKIKDQLSISQSEKRTIAFEQLKTIPSDSSFSLNLNNLGIVQLPDLSNFKTLRKVQLSNNLFTYLPKYIFASDSLKSIDLSSNKIERLRFPKNSNVISVDLSKMALKRIPRSLRKFKHLKYIDLSNNHIRRIPCFLSKMDSLSEIKLNHSFIPVNKRTINRLRNIKQLQLAGNNLSELPKNINKLKKLTNLNLAENKLSNLPHQFKELKNLEHLIFYKNNFTEIPQEIFELNKLKEIDFYYNQLTAIPPEIEKLKKIELLFFSFNLIANLPENMSHLTHVKSLYMHHNQIVFLPNWISEFKHLEILDFGFNKIQNVPDLSGIETLFWVDLQGNNLEQIPMKLLAKPGLKNILLRDNPFILNAKDLDDFQKLIDELAKKEVRVFF